MNPIEYTIRLNDFDFSLLKITRDDKPEKVKEAIANYFTDELNSLGGDASVMVTAEEIQVRWTPVSKANPDTLANYAISLLQKGNYKQGIPILESLSKEIPDDYNVNFNLGMVLSDSGLLEKAMFYIQKAVQIEPESPDAWNALAVAYQRKGDEESALKNMQKSLMLDPENPYTLKNIGALISKTSPAEGLEYFEKAIRYLPQDQSVLYGCGSCLFTLDKLDDADPFLKRAMEINPNSKIAELCRDLRTKIAHRNLRGPLGTETIRPDVMMYCLDALNKFKNRSPEEIRSVAFEIALLGRGGLDINNPDKKYLLKTLPGNFSGLHLLSIMYAGFQAVAPGEDVGVDFSKEYEMAKKMHSEEGI